MSPRDTEPEPEGPSPSLVRPYALVRGRTRTGTSRAIPMEAVVVTVPHPGVAGLTLERAAIATLCQRPHSVAEVSASLSVPVGVARVLVADLAAEGMVHVDLPPDREADGRVDRALLERVLAGLESL